MSLSKNDELKYTLMAIMYEHKLDKDEVDALNLVIEQIEKIVIE